MISDFYKNRKKKQRRISFLVSVSVCVCGAVKFARYVILDQTWPDERCFSVHTEVRQNNLTGMVLETELFAFGLALPRSSIVSVLVFSSIFFYSHLQV